MNIISLDKLDKKLLTPIRLFHEYGIAKNKFIFYCIHDNLYTVTSTEIKTGYAEEYETSSPEIAREKFNNINVGDIYKRPIK